MDLSSARIVSHSIDSASRGRTIADIPLPNLEDAPSKDTHYFAARGVVITVTLSHADRDIIAIGASAGGVEALQKLVAGLPVDFPLLCSSSCICRCRA
jgi:chemotaxis response regulator CheB